MGNTIDGSHYSNSAAPAPAGSDDQSAQIFQAVLKKQISGKAQYAAVKDLAKQAHEQYNQAHGGGSTIGNWWYNDRDYLTPEEQKLYDAAQHKNDEERAGNTSFAEVAGREFLKTGSAGTSELAWSAYKFGTSSDQNETWQHSFNENKENKEAGDRLHPWASWCGTAGGVAAFVGIGLGAAALKGGSAVVAGAAEAAVARGGTAVATEAVEGAIAKGTTAIAGRVAGEGAGAVVGDAAASAAGRAVAEGAADAAVGAAGKGVAKDVVGEGAATAGERVVGEAAGKGAAEAAGIAGGNTGRMSPTTFNALLGAVFGGVGGASNNADTLGHALAGGTIGAGLGAAVGAGVSKAVEVAVPAVSRFVSETVSGKLDVGDRLSPERLSLEQLESIWGAGPPKKGDPPFVPPQNASAPESVVNDAAQRLAAPGAGQGAAIAATGKPVSAAANTVSEALAKGVGKAEKAATNGPADTTPKVTPQSVAAETLQVPPASAERSAKPAAAQVAERVNDPAASARAAAAAGKKVFGTELDGIRYSEALRDRAMEIHAAARKPGTRGYDRGTTAVADVLRADGKIERLVGSELEALKGINPKTGLPNPPAAYGRALKANEVYAGKDGHAEVAINNPSVISDDGVELIKGALNPGDRILAIGTSRNICSNCAKSLEGVGIKVGGQKFPYRGDKTEFRGGYNKEFYKD